jgi:hypothetical protein
MAHCKRFHAKKELKLDCGHTIAAGETFGVTRVFRCERCNQWPLVIQSDGEKSVAIAWKEPVEKADAGQKPA